MWLSFLILSMFTLVLIFIVSYVINRKKRAKKKKYNLFNSLFAGVFMSAFFAFMPTRIATAELSVLGYLRATFLSVFNSMQAFTLGCEFENVAESMEHCPDSLLLVYQIWIAVIFVLAPLFTFGFILSLFKNVSSYLKLLCSFNKDLYVFSELNDKSLTLASDIKSNNFKAMIVFTDVFEDNEEKIYELIEKAKNLGAICFKKDILVIDFKKYSFSKSISFFTISANQTENLTQTIKLIENNKNRDNVHLYVFSTEIESELLLATADKGKVKVRRINEVQSLINRILYERGEVLFETAKKDADGNKHISAVVVGMGNHGREMIKSLSWFCQMDGYRLEINAFDRDKLAEEKFVALAPELMSDTYNGVDIPQEAQYNIKIWPEIDVQTSTFARKIADIKNATYVFVALGNDERNISTAVSLRMYFERLHIHPVIQAVVHDSQQKRALENIKNYRGQSYDIEFIGDVESSYTEKVIIDSDLESEALARHLKWGKEEEFWTYEYNYRSSMASAIHMNARIKCGIPGADKREEDLTEEERDIIEILEHRRWNAYMRAEGYIFSGSKDKSSRNDLAKMHHDLVDFSSLSDEDKRKDSKVGAK